MLQPDITERACGHFLVDVREILTDSSLSFLYYFQYLKQPFPSYERHLMKISQFNGCEEMNGKTCVKGVLHSACSRLASSRGLLQACYFPSVNAYKTG